VKYSGVLHAWFETGTEGLVWCLQSGVPDPRLLYNNLVIIESGDHLIVRDVAGKIIFDGVIEEDFEAGWSPYPRQFELVGRFFSRHWGWVPGFIKRRCTHFMNGQPVALGCWIHWTQRGWLPDEWAALFLPGENKSFHAELITERVKTLPHDI
jgi:hypothetical protein